MSKNLASACGMAAKSAIDATRTKESKPWALWSTKSGAYDSGAVARSGDADGSATGTVTAQFDT
jgi:hypothetical protein